MEGNFIENFKEACKIQGYDPATVLPDVSKYPAHLQEPLTALAEMLINVEAMNGGWKADHNNYEQEKWFLVYDMEKSKNNPSGFRLYYAYYVRTLSSVGSRFSYRSEEIALHAAKKFEGTLRKIFVTP